ncbi:MAG: hypothetical protein GW886_04250 [Rhodobacterales bacterium]|nr:hypothetical protein [Rhodobacterales bacterium]
MKLTPLPDGGFQIDALDLGAALGLAPATIPALMRAGQITHVSETGTGEDEGRFRVTFRHGHVRLRLTVDAQGEVLARSLIRSPPPAPRNAPD